MELTIKHSEVSLSELEVFDRLKYIRTVFDVGARMQMDSSTVPSIVDYLELKPKPTYHLFEPNPVYAKELREATTGKKNVIVNEFGLGDYDGEIGYHDAWQAFAGSPAFKGEVDRFLKVRTLDGYCKEHNIKRIDFLKSDTEGFEVKVLQGAANMLKNIHYIQFEVWDNLAEMTGILSNFTIQDMGFRNYFCTNKLW